VSRLARNGDRAGPAIDELDRVRNQVAKDLPQPHRIAQHRWQLGREQELDALLFRQRPHALHGLGQYRPRLELEIGFLGVRGDRGGQQLADRVAHAEHAVAGGLDQPLRLGRHRGPKLVERLVAQIGHRRERRLQVVGGELRELPQLDVRLPEQIERSPEIHRRLLEVGLERQPDVEEHGLQQRKLPLQQLWPSLGALGGQLPKVALQVLIVRAQKELRRHADFGVRMPHAHMPFQVVFVPGRFEQRGEVGPLRLFEPRDQPGVAEELQRLRERHQMRVEGLDERVGERGEAGRHRLQARGVFGGEAQKRQSGR
jgi:hypothetical protein